MVKFHRLLEKMDLMSKCPEKMVYVHSQYFRLISNSKDGLNSSENLIIYEIND